MQPAWSPDKIRLRNSPSGEWTGRSSKQSNSERH